MNSLTRNLKVGISGNDVLEVTKLMVQRNLLSKETRLFDINVEVATKILQAKNNLVIDGIFGNKSFQALIKNDSQILSEPIVDVMNPVHRGGDKELLMFHALKRGLYYISQGVGEIGGNNKGKWVAHFHNVSEERLLTGSWPWCAVSVDTFYKEASLELKVDKGFNRSGLALNIRNQVKPRNPNGLHLLKPDKFYPGMLAFWTRGDTGWQGHIEMVHTVIDDLVIFLGGNRTSKVDLFVQ